MCDTISEPKKVKKETSPKGLKEKKIMTLNEAKKQLKKHMKYANRLKEGGKAWDREMKICTKYKDICMTLYNKEWAEKYRY